MRQSMTVDLSDMMEQLFPEPEPERRSSIPARGSLVAPVDKETARSIASQTNLDAKRMVVELAGDEQVSVWAEALAQWMQQHSQGSTISLLTLQQALEKPLVEVWLGLLLSNQQHYEWKLQGDFYSNTEDILLKV